MSIQDGAVKYSDLIGRLILDLRTTDELGRVDDVWMVPDAHRVVGIFYKSGFLANQKKALNLAQLESIGNDAIMVNSVIVEAIEETRQSDSLIGHEVWTDDGNKIGKISDFLFDPKSGIISHYLFAASGWSGITDGTYLLATESIHTLGKKRLIISEATAKSSTLYTGGLRQRLGSVVEQTKERTQALSEQAKGLLEQMKERTQALGDQVKERTQTLGDQVKERTQTLGDTARSNVSDLLETAQDRLNPAAPEVVPSTVTTPELETPSTSPTLPVLPPIEPAPDYTRDLL